MCDELQCKSFLRSGTSYCHLHFPFLCCVYMIQLTLFVWLMNQALAYLKYVDREIGIPSGNCSKSGVLQA